MTESQNIFTKHSGKILRIKKAKKNDLDEEHLFVFINNTWMTALVNFLKMYLS